MSIHYLLDNESNPVADSTIRNVSFNVTDSDRTGGWIVRVDDGLVFDPDTITSFNSLLTAKYASLLEFYPGFTNIVFDSLEDASGVDAPTASGATIGGRNSLSVSGASGTFDTVAVALGGSPVQAVITWEAFSLAATDDKADRQTLEFQEEPSSDLQVEVSFNNGVSFIGPVTDGGLENIPLADQGSNFILRVTNAAGAGTRRYLGSWAVIF